MKNMKLSYWLIALIVTCAGCVLYAMVTFRVDEAVLLDGQADSYHAGWTYVNAEGNSLVIPEEAVNIPDLEGNSYSIENRLPTIYNEDTCMGVRTYNQNLKVYVDGTLIYDFSNSDNRMFATSSGTAWHMIPLYSKYSGKKIQMVYDSDYITNKHSFGEVYLDRTSSILGTIIVSRSMDILLCILIAILGASMIIFSFMISKLKKDYHAPLYLGIHALIMACWSLLETGVIQIFYPNTVVIELLSAFCFMLMPIPFLFYIFQMYFKNRKDLCNQVGLLLVLINFAALILGGFFGISVYYGFIAAYLVLSGVMIVFIFLGIYDYYRTRDRKLIFYILSTILLISFEGFDLINFFTGQPVDYSYHYRIGFLIYMSLVTAYSYKRYAKYSYDYVERLALEKMAYEDFLTKCKNRMFYNTQLEDTEQHMSQYYQVGIVIMDLNNLKLTNDVYGHSSGDVLIKACAKVINTAFSGMGECCRIGGDEFAMILKNVSSDKIKQGFLRMLDEVEHYNYSSPYFLEIAYG